MHAWLYVQRHVDVVWVRWHLLLLHSLLLHLTQTLNLSCSQAWAALSPTELADKEEFYKGQQGAASGFLRLALTTLQVRI